MALFTECHLVSTCQSTDDRTITPCEGLWGRLAVTNIFILTLHRIIVRYVVGIGNLWLIPRTIGWRELGLVGIQLATCIGRSLAKYKPGECGLLPREMGKGGFLRQAWGLRLRCRHVYVIAPV
jgi:hypothetical protein